MSRRKLVFITILLGAGVGPYAMSAGGLASVKAKFDSWLQGFGSENTPMSANKSDGTGYVPTVGRFAPGGVDSSQPFIANDPRHDTSPRTFALHEVFDFNITPNVVIQQWPRISTSLAQLEMSGMRVALVTGTQPDDLHGSLTYYFDKTQRMQRITFQGQTGDAGKLVTLLTQYHGFKAEKSLGAGLYTKKWNGKPTSALWIENSPMITSDATNSRYSIVLEINRTDGPYRLSAEFVEQLAQYKQVGRW